MDYRYFVLGNIFFIIDLNLGGRSATNSLPEIIPTLTEQLDDKLIVYRDSEGIYDCVNRETCDIYPVKPGWVFTDLCDVLDELKYFE